MVDARQELPTLASCVKADADVGGWRALAALPVCRARPIKARFTQDSREGDMAGRRRCLRSEGSGKHRAKVVPLLQGMQGKHGATAVS